MTTYAEDSTRAAHRRIGECRRGVYGGRARGWLVHYPDGRTVEVHIVPEPTLAEVLADYSGAIGATPISERETHA